MNEPPFDPVPLPSRADRETPRWVIAAGLVTLVVVVVLVVLVTVGGHGPGRHGGLGTPSPAVGVLARVGTSR